MKGVHNIEERIQTMHTKPRAHRDEDGRAWLVCVVWTNKKRVYMVHITEVSSMEWNKLTTAGRLEYNFDIDAGDS